MFGLFEAGGNIIGSFINKQSQDNANYLNQRNFDKQMDYTRSRDYINDLRYENELAYNRAFAEDERSYQRALQQEIFDREDTAIERQASQLSKLGLNPLTQNMQGLGSGSVVSSTSAPSTPNSVNASQPSAPNIQAFSGFNFGSLEPSLDFLNEMDKLHTAGVQRDLLRSQENYQKLVNLAYANDNDITLDSEGNPVGIAKTVSNQKLREREYEGKGHENREKSANANRSERVDDMQRSTGATDRSSMPSQMAYDATYAAQRAVTGIKNAYNQHVDMNNSKSDSKIAKLKDRLQQAGSKLLTTSANAVISNSKKMANFFSRKNNAIHYSASNDRSGRMR